MAPWHTVLDFWFGAPGGPQPQGQRDRWFDRDPAFDLLVRERFLSTCRAAAGGELEGWLAEPRAALAYVIVCDQFPRNVFRDSAEAFAGDRRALAAARSMVGSRRDEGLAALERAFLYMPYVHAEDLRCQAVALELFRGLLQYPDTADFYPSAARHFDVVARFGRFPHRNAALRRPSSAAELEFLARPGSRF
jgi:uncharacterized protein (DUF924 family)